MSKEKQLIEIEIKAKEVSTKDGKKFTAFRALREDGRWIDCKFRQDVPKDIPKESGMLKVTKEQVDYQGPDKVKWPVIWVRDYEEFVPLEQVNNHRDVDKELPF